MIDNIGMEGRNPQFMIDKVNELVNAINTLLPADYVSTTVPQTPTQFPQPLTVDPQATPPIADQPQGAQNIPVAPETPASFGDLANADPATLPQVPARGPFHPNNPRPENA